MVSDKKKFITWSDETDRKKYLKNFEKQNPELFDLTKGTRYCSTDLTLEHHKNLCELLDINFGKDWRVYLKLVYSPDLLQYRFTFREKHPEEKYFIHQKRVEYYRVAKKLLASYHFDGIEKTRESINADKFRFRWTFKKDDGSRERVNLISSKLYESLYGHKEELAESLYGHTVNE